jgi:predicted SprT family Zn-dependent metalloprotease
MFDLIREQVFVNAPTHHLDPLPYHADLRDYLKQNECELWNWFSSGQARADYAENLRLELLKYTYRLDMQGHPELYQTVEEVKTALQLDVPVTLYQAQNNSDLNAALLHIPGEGHIVFSGSILSLLNTDEVKSVIGHELAHYQLWERDGGEFHIADRLLHAVALDPRASTSHEETARRFQLFTEIFADRGSLRATGNAQPVIASLVKIQTGLAQVSADSYLKQAEEIFSNGNIATEGVSHPEAFIRARALTLWQENGDGATDDIRRMIEGSISLDTLDLIDQMRLTAATLAILKRLLKPKWFQTPATLGHARLYFDQFQAVNGDETGNPDGLRSHDSRIREYLCYVLLDFVKADPDLDEMPLAAAFELSRGLEIGDQFEKLAAKELKMGVRDLRRIKELAVEMLNKAEATGE